ncbi:arylamine N-acetyltransferase, partial [Bacillus vallismortis]|nr:arylamine N-acetyltransferase [Bacillus vallismortis]
APKRTPTGRMVFTARNFTINENGCEGQKRDIGPSAFEEKLNPYFL